MLVGKTNSLSVASAYGTDVSEMFIVVKVHAEVSSTSFQSVLGHHNTYQIPMMFQSANMFYNTYSRAIYGSSASGKTSEGDYRAWLNGEPYIATSLNTADSVGNVSRWNPTELNV